MLNLEHIERVVIMRYDRSGRGLPAVVAKQGDDEFVLFVGCLSHAEAFLGHIEKLLGDRVLETEEW